MLDENQNTIIPNQFDYLRWQIDADDGVAADRSEQFVNGVAQTKNNVQTNAPSAGIPSFTMNYGRTQISGGLFYLSGEIAEIILLDKHPTAGEITDWQTYVTSEWGL